jgi:molybdate transport system substrate-binding protein
MRSFSCKSASLVFTTVLTLVAACGDAPGSRADEARVAAGSSLTDVITRLGAAFEAQGGGHVVASFGASSTLAAQFREGAPPGVFLSASPEWADEIERAGLAEPGTRADLLANSLVAVIPLRAKARPASLTDLAEPRFARIAVADMTAVPAGRYARAALEAAGVLEALRGRLVAAQDVRGALAYAERGEADLALVYATDAAASARVEIAFRVPPDLHPRIVYPMLLVKGASPASRRFHKFLRSPAAWEEFERAGFTRP